MLKYATIADVNPNGFPALLENIVTDLNEIDERIKEQEDALTKQINEQDRRIEAVRQERYRLDRKLDDEYAILAPLQKRRTGFDELRRSIRLAELTQLLKRYPSDTFISAADTSRLCIVLGQNNNDLLLLLIDPDKLHVTRRRKAALRDPYCDTYFVDSVIKGVWNAWNTWNGKNRKQRWHSAVENCSSSFLQTAVSLLPGEVFDRFTTQPLPPPGVVFPNHYSAKLTTGIFDQLIKAAQADIDNLTKPEPTEEK